MKTIKLNRPPAPAKRPKCPGCGSPLRPYWNRVSERLSGKVSEWTIDVRFEGRYHAYGAFCTLRCCEQYANAVFKRTGIKFAAPA